MKYASLALLAALLISNVGLVIQNTSKLHALHAIKENTARIQKDQERVADRLAPTEWQRIQREYQR